MLARRLARPPRLLLALGLLAAAGWACRFPLRRASAPVALEHAPPAPQTPTPDEAIAIEPVPTEVAEPAPPPPDPPAAPAPKPAASAPKVLSALVEGEGGDDMPLGQATPLEMEQIGRLLAAAHRELYGVPPGPERLLVAWAHVAHEIARGSGSIEHNLANIVVSLRWRGGWHLRRVMERDFFGKEQWAVLKIRFRSYPTPYDGALDYWRVITGNFGSALPHFDGGDARSAGRVLCERGFSTSSCEGYGQGIRGLYSEIRATYAHQLRSIMAPRPQAPMAADDWRSLAASRPRELCADRSE